MIEKRQIKTHSTPDRGDLSVIDASEVPFAVKRMFWITRMQSLARRGGHAHYKGEQFMFAPIGGVQIHATGPGLQQTLVTLAGPEAALYVPPMHWLDIRNTSPKTVLVVFASNEYSESDYIRNKHEFETLARAL